MNQIHRLSLISHKTEMGDMNSIGPFTSIGLPGESYGRDPTEFASDLRSVKIGSGNIIRENITIHDNVMIGDQNMIMSHSHLGHDVIIGNHVTISTACIIGGHTQIHDGANIGLNSTTHQFVTIGAYAMVGMGSVVVEDVPPFAKVVGNPARIIGWNEVGIERAKFTPKEIEAIREGNTDWHRLFNSTHTRDIVKRKK